MRIRVGITVIEPQVLELNKHVAIGATDPKVSDVIYTTPHVGGVSNFEQLPCTM